MEIEKFSKLLERALSGQEPLLNDWDVFRSANYFTKENINHAIDKINQIIAQENHPQLKNALFLKAYMYQWGQDRAVNFPEAIKLYEQAILLKQPSAMAHRADMHRLGLGGHVAMTEAIKLYEQAFDLGNHAPMILQAQRFIGLINSKGGDYDYMRKQYQLFYNEPKAIHEPRSTGYYNYVNGWDSYFYQCWNEENRPQPNSTDDLKEGIRLLDKAIALGNADAMVIRARIHQNSIYTMRGYAHNQTRFILEPIDYNKALQLNEQAINLGNFDAMVSIGEIYEKVKYRYDKKEFDEIITPPNPERLLLCKHALKFSRLVTLMDITINELEKKKKTNPLQYSSVVEKARLLLKKLSIEGEQFFKSPNAEQFKKFKTQCTLAIEDAREEFKKDRSFWYKIHPILRAIIGFFATLAVLPAVMVAIGSDKGYSATFFATPKTPSEEQLDYIKDRLSDIKDIDKKDEVPPSEAIKNNT